jgi:hypothetical protein
MSLLFCVTSTVIGQTKIGVYVSNDNTKFTGDKPERISYQLGSGLMVGAKVKFQLIEDLWLSLEPGYIMGNASIRERDPNIDTITYNHDVTNRSFTLPVKVNAYITKRFFASAGVEVSVFTRSELDRFDETINLKDEFASFNVSLTFGIGYSIPIKKCQLDIELSHVQSVNNLSRDPSDDSYVPRIRLTSTRPSLTFLIPIGHANE